MHCTFHKTKCSNGLLFKEAAAVIGVQGRGEFWKVFTMYRWQHFFFLKLLCLCASPLVPCLHVSARYWTRIKCLWLLNETIVSVIFFNCNWISCYLIKLVWQWYKKASETSTNAVFKDCFTKLLSIAVSRNDIFSFEPECSCLRGWTENKIWSMFQPQIFYHVHSIHFSFLSFGSYCIKRWVKCHEGHHGSKSKSGFNYLWERVFPCT